MAYLHQLERSLTVPSLTEAIRLLESEKFQQLTSAHIRDVAEYRPIQIGEEWFFHKAFTTGKEVAASLSYAKCVGKDVVLDDIRRLHASALGPSESARGTSKPTD